MHTITLTQPLTQSTTFVKTVSGFSGRFSVSPKMKLDHTHYDDAVSSEDIEEINQQENPAQVLSTKSKKKEKKVVYHCGDYIEVPGGTESIEWTDDEGQTYEIDISDLQEYDGDDGEIEYTDSKRKKTKIKCPTYNPRMIQALMMQHMRTRVHS